MTSEAPWHGGIPVRLHRSTHRLALATALAGAFVLAGCIGPSAPAAAVEPLDPLDQPPSGRVVAYDMYVGLADIQPHGEQRVSMFAFGLAPEGPFTVPGPELRVREGDTLRVTLHSPGGLPHTIHWHGLSVPWAMDGVPFHTQTVSTEPEEYVYEFVVRESGTYWYHCHVDAPTHIDFGLFGAIIVEPRDPAQDPPFDREATLILHEVDAHTAANSPVVNGVVFGADRSPAESPLPDDVADAPAWAQRHARDTVQLVGIIAGDETGVYVSSKGPQEHYPASSIRYHPYYDTFMINAKSFPETEPVMTRTGETLRLRLINAGQLVHTMHLHGHHMLVTHKDGYPLPAAARYHADTLLIGPGERYDVYVQARNPGIWDFHDHGGSWEIGAYAANDHAYPGGMTTLVVYEDFEHAMAAGDMPARGWQAKDFLVHAPSYRGPAPVHAHR